jgi:hypothetical protein
MEQEQAKETEQAKSTVHRLVELLESYGYWVWTASAANSSGLIEVWVSTNRKN